MQREREREREREKQRKIKEKIIKKEYQERIATEHNKRPIKTSQRNRTKIERKGEHFLGFCSIKKLSYIRENKIPNRTMRNNREKNETKA